MALLQELYETGNDPAFNDAFNGWVLLLRKEFTEFGGRVELTIRIIREHAIYHVLSKLGLG